MKLSHRKTGVVILIFTVLVTFHWYFAHLTKYFAGDIEQLIPELGVAVLILGITGVVYIFKKEFMDVVLGHTIIIASVIVGIHWFYAHLAKGMMVPELGLAVIGTAILGIGLLSKKIEVKK